MDIFKRHGDHGHEEKKHGHGHQTEDGARQHFLACLYWLKRRDLGASSDTAISTIEKFIDTPKNLTSRLVGHPAWSATLPVRKTIVVVAYAAFIALLITYKSIKHDGTFHERIAFRAAWITATQTSLPFLLAVRVNPIGLLLGTSYERINWFHRWASRVFFASATIHGGFFTYEWLAASFFWTEIKTVKMVLPGIAAWFILAWTVISTIPFFRRIKYELFVVQHIISVVLLLVFLVLHVPDHHLFSIWCAVGVFAYDVVTRSANPIWRNLRLRVSANPSVRYAHDAQVEAVDSELTVMTVRDVGFKWIPGQHVLIWSPTFRWETPHPFTITNIPDSQTKTQDLQLTIKTKTGLTRDLNDWARRTGLRGDTGGLRVMVTGPFGAVPNWKQYENLVLVAASTGGSFTTPILEDLLSSQSPGCIRTISALYIVRHTAHAKVYLQRITRLLSRAKEMGISTKIQVAVTRGPNTVSEGVLQDESRERLIDPETARGPSVELERFSIDSARSSESAKEDQLLKEEVDMDLDGAYASAIEHTDGRPEIATFIRTAVGDVPGNVAVAVCGGEAIERAVKMSVATLRRRSGMDAGDTVFNLVKTLSKDNVLLPTMNNAFDTENSCFKNTVFNDHTPALVTKCDIYPLDIHSHSRLIYTASVQSLQFSSSLHNYTTSPNMCHLTIYHFTRCDTQRRVIINPTIGATAYHPFELPPPCHHSTNEPLPAPEDPNAAAPCPVHGPCCHPGQVFVCEQKDDPKARCMGWQANHRILEPEMLELFDSNLLPITYEHWRTMSDNSDEFAYEEDIRREFFDAGAKMWYLWNWGQEIIDTISHSQSHPFGAKIEREDALDHGECYWNWMIARKELLQLTEAWEDLASMGCMEVCPSKLLAVHPWMKYAFHGWNERQPVDFPQFRGIPFRFVKNLERQRDILRWHPYYARRDMPSTPNLVERLWKSPTIPQTHNPELPHELGKENMGWPAEWKGIYDVAARCDSLPLRKYAEPSNLYSMQGSVASAPIQPEPQPEKQYRPQYTSESEPNYDDGYESPSTHSSGPRTPPWAITYGQEPKKIKWGPVNWDQAATFVQSPPVSPETVPSRPIPSMVRVYNEESLSKLKHFVPREGMLDLIPLSDSESDSEEVRRLKRRRSEDDGKTGMKPVKKYRTA
ncbi:unnamed protein product [Fusarium graminearum]|nr:unnamed protein product [Fusarium graminearum]